MHINYPCFESRFSYLFKMIAFWMAVGYLSGKGRAEYEVDKVLYASKKRIIKVHRRQGTARSFIYFSVHKRVPVNSHVGEYQWYYEEYEIFHNKELDRMCFRINGYKHYPYDVK